MEKCALVSLSDIDTATRTEKQSAKTMPVLADDPSVNVMPCLPGLMPQSQTSLTINTTCSGRLQRATPCGTQRTIPHNAHETVVVSTNPSAVVVELVLLFYSIQLTRNVVQVARLSLTIKDAQVNKEVKVKAVKVKAVRVKAVKAAQVNKEVKVKAVKVK